MLIDGVKIEEVSDRVLVEAILQNNRFGEVARKRSESDPVFKVWDKKARALLAEVTRRGLFEVSEEEKAKIDGERHL